MPEIDETVARVEGELRRYSHVLTHEFQRAAERIKLSLAPIEVEMWADEGLAIARNSFRSWEAAREYFKVSPGLAEDLAFPQLMEWASLGKNLSSKSAAVASSFFNASPQTLGHISPSEFPTWVGLGTRLHRDHWKSGLLCQKLFDVSPALLHHLTLAELGALVEFFEALANRSSDHAVECLDAAEATLLALESSDRGRFISLGITLAERHWRGAKDYFLNGPRSLSLVNSSDRDLFFEVVSDLADSSIEESVEFFTQVPKHLSEVDKTAQGEVLKLGAQILKLSSNAAMEFLKNAPVLLRKITVRELSEWVGMGLTVLDDSLEAGTAFFKINSNRATLALQSVARGVDLEEVRDVLRMYCKGLTGRSLSLTSSQEIVDKGIGWTSVEKPTTEGSAIFLPPFLDDFETKAYNYEAYKVLVTHQAAHLEFQTFDFSFDRSSLLFDDLRAGIESILASDKPTITDFERFLDLFRDRRLARDVFTVLEDARIDARVRMEYRGIRKGYDRVQQLSLSTRPTVSSLPYRQGLLEYLVQASLDSSLSCEVPDLFAEYYAAAAILLRRLQRSGATVEDTGEATIRVYALARSLPNILLGAELLVELNLDDLGESIVPLSADEFVATDLRAELEGAGESYASPDDVDYRGELKPELTQTMMKLREDNRDNGDVMSYEIPAELLQELLAKSAEIEIMELISGEVDSSSGIFITNIMKEQERAKASRAAKQRRGGRRDNIDDYEAMPEDDGTVSYYYDEWDFRAQDYRPNWCRLKEKLVQEGNVRFFDDTLREHATLANDIKRQFEMIKLQQFKKLKRMQDGEEYELDHVIESVVEKKAGLSPSDKVYWRKNKVQRDIAVALLLDMSASTDEEIKDPDPSAVDLWYEEWLNRDSNYMAVKMPPREPGRRIIDVEKESIVLLIRALEVIGDKYGIYGFSGYGRDNVEFFVVKDFEEEFGDTTKKRIDKIQPVRGTRMGPAIRHCINRLGNTEAKIRLLILLSDGRPQDHDYGKDRTEKDYAIHDTRMALMEAKWRNIVPFCLTVDKAGQDYLKSMMGDMAYEVVNDIESLPKRLPTLYRKLTT